MLDQVPADVTGTTNELQELVARRRAALGAPGQPLSYKQAALRSRGLVSHEQIRKIELGQHGGNISDRIADGLAMALEVPVAEVYRAANTPRPAGRWHWPARFDRLPDGDRRLVEDVANGLLSAYERGLRER